MLTLNIKTAAFYGKIENIDKDFPFRATVDDYFKRLCSCHVGIIFISHCWELGGKEREYLIHWGFYTITGLGVILLSCQRVTPLSI